MNDDLEVIGLDRDENIPADSSELSAPEFTNYVFSNEDETGQIGLGTLLNMFYGAVGTGRIGIMRAKHENGELHDLLVGMTNIDGVVECMPIALALSNDAAAKYSSPDGKGGWIDPRQINVIEDVGLSG